MMRFVILLTLILGANFYVFYRLWHLLPGGATAHALLIVCACILVSAPFLSIFAGERMPLPLTRVLYVAGTSWLVMLLYLLMLFLLADLARLLHLLPAGWLTQGSWKGFGALAAVMLALTGYGYAVYRDKDRVELDITVDKPLERPVRIVAVSDLHLGYAIGRRELERWISTIESEQPDAVLIAGDLVDNSVQTLYKMGMPAVLRGLRATYGVYAVPGNHEYIGGIAPSVQFYKDAGITLLRDSVASVGGLFLVAGRDDRTNTGRMSLDGLMAGADASMPVVLLDHQPYDLDATAGAGVDLQISGHTHKGQVWPISAITGMIFEKPHGYLRKGDAHFYISSGLGIWGGKFRIGTRSEYLVITLRGR